MILAIAKSRLWNLRHDRAAFVLAFIVPIVFFSIFASIFGRSSGRATTAAVRLAVVDEDQSANSRRFLAALRAESALKVSDAPRAESGASVRYTAASAEAAVRAGELPVALVVPKGFGQSAIGFGPAADRAKLVILSDPSDPIAPQVLAGLLQKVAMTAMPDVMARGGIDALDRWGGNLTPEQRQRLEENVRGLSERPAPSPSGGAGGGAGLVEVTRRDVLGQKKGNPMIAFYAAGIGVMFLLFSAAGAGGALIEEAETGTLDRILSTRVSMSRLLAGKLVYLAGIAATQLTVMFLWGALVFGLSMKGHWTGFFIMTVSTALAASTFGLLLAALSRSRMQLVALSNLTVLAMSAVGGSMFPRFLMPEIMQKIGLITLNAWAIDGFQKVFWREEPLTRLWPQVLVLCAISVVFFALARRVARRWEAI
ncbi:MAG: ABC transporter permease [Acidobacteria bacterium]|nr:ABC transporter permease [Acidobacteriota bacterium]MCA1609801.1 ABC transporter permease [Acidobacteriota bacterium]